MNRLTHDRLQRVRAVVEAAIEREPEERPAFVDRVCGDDAELRAEVESLLAVDGPADGFMEPPIHGAVRGVLSMADGLQAAGRRIGAYEIVDMIATGGMGTVYRAVRADAEFDRQVAIKVIRRGMDTVQLVRRFQRERQTLANLDHPNITRLLDGGTTEDGLPYIVMELIEGAPINEYCDAGRLNVHERLALFLTACDAVQYAHQHLIVHRDLKPSNILVSAAGVPKLLDFGISKLLDVDASEPSYPATMTTLRVMTPEYSSPEQVRGDRITTASDVYALGVILYELLTGRLPYATTSPMRHELERAICEDEPERPSASVSRTTAFVARTGASRTITPHDVAAARGERVDQLRKRLRGDIDNIVMVALRKDPRRRYASVQQFADDIRRYLAGRPVHAQPDTFVYRTRKFVRRNRTAVLMSTALLLALLGATISTTFGLVRARRAETKAALQRDAAQGVVQFLQRALAAGSPYRRDGDVSILDFLEEASGRIDHELRGEPEAEASVRVTLGQTYASLWRWDAAVPHLERAMEIYRDTGQSKTEAAANCLSTLGRALTFEHDMRAVQYQWEALKTRQRLYPAGHPLIAESMSNLAFAQWSAFNPPDWDQADAFYRRSLELYDQAPTANKADIARAAFSYATMCMAQWRFADADRLYTRALALYRDLIAAGPVDRYTVECLSRYAFLLMQAGRYEEAERYLKDAIELTPSRLGNLGDSSPQWLLGTLYHLRGDPEAALAQYHRTLAAQCVRLAHQKGNQRRRLRSLARAYRVAATERGPAPPPRKVFGLLKILKCEDNMRLAARMTDYASLLRDLGQTRSAASLYRYALHTLFSEVWTNHWRIAECKCHLGGTLTELGEYAEAEEMILDAFFVSAADFGRTHRRTREAAAEAVKLYDAVGEKQLADQFRHYVLPDPATLPPSYIKLRTSPIAWRIRCRPNALHG